MNRNTLIFIGIACAVIIVLAIMQSSYNSPVNTARRQLHNEMMIMRVEMLGKLGTKEAIPEIRKILQDKNKQVRVTAEQALRKLGISDEEIQKAKESK